MLNSQEQLRAIADAMLVSVSYVDPQMRWQFENKKLCGIIRAKSDEIVGKQVVDVSRQISFRLTKLEINAVLNGETILYEQETAHVTEAGFTRRQLRPHRLEDGSVAGIIVLVDDISEQGQVEEGMPLLADIVRYSNDAIVTETLDGIITSWNQGAERIFGYAAHEIIHKPITLLMPPERIDEEASLFQRIMTGKIVQNYDTVRVTKDGSRIFVSVSLSPIRDNSGTVIGASKIAHDVTERKRAEQEIASLAKFPSENPQLVLRMSNVGMLLYANSPAQTLLAELGASVGEPVPAPWRDFTADALATRMTRDIEIQHGERIWWLHAVPISGESYLNIYGVDISKRKRAEEALRRSSERLAALNRLDRIITSKVAITQVYDNFVKELHALMPLDRTAVVRLNETGDQWQVAHQWTQHQPAILPGVWWPVEGSVIEWLVKNRILYSEPEIGEHDDWPETAILQREGIRSRLLLPLTIQGRVIGVLTVASCQTAAFSEEDQSILVTVADQLAIAIQNSDLYEQVQHHAIELEQRVIERTAQLEASNKELEAFTYSVSHDLRSPLRAIDGFSRILLRDYGDQVPTEAERYLNLVRDNAQQMGTLIDELLTFSRLNRQPLEKQTVDLGSIASHVLEEMSSAQEGRQIQILIAQVPTCQGDPALLKQVYVNLLSNALKFTRLRDTARIEVGYQQTDDEIVYYVKDNGAGFDMAYADKLFRVFQRLHRADEFPGTGVGLAIVQRIIHRHGGRIWAQAEIDQGATFYFTLEGEIIND